jgi:hypothetical protein
VTRQATSGYEELFAFFISRSSSGCCRYCVYRGDALQLPNWFFAESDPNNQLVRSRF